MSLEVKSATGQLRLLAYIPDFSADGATLATLLNNIQIGNVSSCPDAQKLTITARASANSPVKAEPAQRVRRLR